MNEKTIRVLDAVMALSRVRPSEDVVIVALNTAKRFHEEHPFATCLLTFDRNVVEALHNVFENMQVCDTIPDEEKDFLACLPLPNILSCEAYACDANASLFLEYFHMKANEAEKFCSTAHEMFGDVVINGDVMPFETSVKNQVFLNAYGNMTIPLALSDDDGEMLVEIRPDVNRLVHALTLQYSTGEDAMREVLELRRNEEHSTPTM